MVIATERTVKSERERKARMAQPSYSFLHITITAFAYFLLAWALFIPSTSGIFMKKETAVPIPYNKSEGQKKKNHHRHIDIVILWSTKSKCPTGVSSPLRVSTPTYSSSISLVVSMLALTHTRTQNTQQRNGLGLRFIE